MTKTPKSPAPLILITAVVLLTSFFVISNIAKQKNNSIQNNQTSKFTESDFPQDYPLYPGAKFLYTQAAPSCEDAPARADECGKTGWFYQSTENAKTVSAWYKSRKPITGWTFESYNGNPDDPNNNPIFGYLVNKNQENIPVSFTQNPDNTSTIEIYPNLSVK